MDRKSCIYRYIFGVYISPMATHEPTFVKLYHAWNSVSPFYLIALLQSISVDLGNGAQKQRAQHIADKFGRLQVVQLPSNLEDFVKETNLASKSFELFGLWDTRHFQKNSFCPLSIASRMDRAFS
jgi:hypothetical protein